MRHSFNQCWLSPVLSAHHMLGVCLGLALAVPGAFAQQPDHQPKSIEAFVPADAFLALATDDAQATARLFQQTPWGTNLQSASWNGYLAALEKSDTPSALCLLPAFGVDWPHLAKFATPVCLCSFSDGKKEPATALIVDVRSSPAAAKVLPQQAAAYFASRGARVSEEKLTRGQWTIYSRARGNGKETNCLAREDFVAFVTSRDGSRQLISLWDSEQPAALGDSPEYQKVQTQAAGMLKEKGHVRLWVQPLPLVRSFPNPPASGKRGRGDWRARVERTGIAGVKSISGTISLTESDAASFEIGLAAIAPRPFEGALQMATFKEGAWRDPPDWVDANVASWSIQYRDVEPWFNGLGAVFDEVARDPGAFRDFIDGLKSLSDGPKIDVRREIVPRLKPALTMLSDFGGAKLAWNPSGRRDLVILDVKDSDDLEKVFHRWFRVDVEDGGVRHDSVNAQALWSADAGRALFIDSGGDPERRFSSLALTKDALLISTDELLLRSILSGQIPKMPLVNDARYRTARNFLQTRDANTTSLRSWALNAAICQSAYEKLRAGRPDKGDAEGALLALILCGSAEPPGGLAQMLPPWRDIAPSLGMSAFSLRVLPEGFAGVVGILPD